MENIEGIITEFLHCYCEKTDLNKISSFLSDDVSWTGISSYNHAENKDDAVKLIEQEFVDNSEPYSKQIDSIKITECGTCALVSVNTTQIRTSLVIDITSGLIKSFHASVPYSNQTSNQLPQINSDQDELQKQQKLRIAAHHAGLIYWEYDIVNSVLNAPYKDIWYDGMPTKMIDYPQSFINAGYLDNDSVNNYLEMHRALKRGEPIAEGKVHLSGMLSDNSWYMVKYTTIFNEDGKPVKAYATAHKLETYQEMEERFTIAVENEGIFVWTFDLSINQLIPSKRMMRLYGDSEFYWVNMEPFTLQTVAHSNVHPDDLPSFVAMYRKLQNGERNVTAIIRKHNLKTYKWDYLHITYTTVCDHFDNPVRIICSASDVTALCEARKKYREFLNYKHLLQKSTLVTYNFNLTQNTCTGGESKNPKLLKYQTEGTVDSFFSRVYRNFPSLAEADNFKTKVSRQKLLDLYASGNTTPSIEYRFSFESGKPQWRSTTAEMVENPETHDIEAFVYTVDIDKQKKMQLTVDKLIDQDYEFIGLVDAKTGNLNVFGEKGDQNLFQSTYDGNIYDEKLPIVLRYIVDDDVYDELLEKLDRKNLIKQLAKQDAFSFMYPSKSSENEITRKKRWNVSYLDSGRTTILVTRTDVTELFEIEQKQKDLLSHALIQAKQASEAKTEFLSRMSHEIRTPMNAIIGMTTLAAQSIKDTNQVADCLAKIGISARFLLSLINDILDMSRIESGKIVIKQEKIPFESFIKSINTICYSQAEAKGINYESIITSFTEDYYIGDTMKLQQVLINIIGNAIKFTNSGGRIQFIISQEHLTNDKALFHFTVNDTGIGITEDFIPKIFEPFEQEHTGTTNIYSGTGLGLAICKNLVDIMGGNISVNSILGIGTEFTIDIILGICHETHEFLYPDNDLNYKELTALIVDDEIIVCDQTQQILSDLGMKASYVTSGEEAISVVQNKWMENTAFDFILIDWKMPIMDGIETTKRIRAITGNDVTIIIITAYDWIPIEAEAKKAGANMLISKPLFKTSLSSAFEQIYATKKQLPTNKIIEEYDFTNKKILLCEDHILNVEVAKRLLEKKGAEVDVAENGLIGLEKFAEKQDMYYSAILMDIRMPIMDGLATTKSIRQLQKPYAKSIPIIAMSANAFDEDIEKSKQAGMNEHIAKPIDPDILFHILKVYFDR